MTSQPVAVLRSHQTNVVDVVIHQAMSKIFSYAKDSVSIVTTKCLLGKFSLVINSKTVFHFSGAEHMGYTLSTMR